MLNTKSNKKHKPIIASNVTPSNNMKYKLKETFSQSMMNYEIIRHNVQTDIQEKRTT